LKPGNANLPIGVVQIACCGGPLSRRQSGDWRSRECAST
jgi:hypothetical protein